MENSPLAFIDLKKQYQEIQKSLKDRFAKVLESAAFIQGPEVKELEGALSEYTSVPEVITCANGTDALTLPLLALGVKPGDAVFCPAFTFIATSEVVSLRGAYPVFVDVDPRTFNMDPNDLEKKILQTRQNGEYIPRAVITVDLFGLPADYYRIHEIAKRYELFILEDAAQGFGGEINHKKAGNFGDISATSFFPAKPLGCYGDGGAVFTHDRELAAKIRSLKVHGAGSDKYNHIYVGLNSRLDTLQAAILLEKLKIFPKELEARQNVANFYTSLLKDLVEVPFVNEGYLSSWAQYTIKVPPSKREKLMSFLKAQGIPTMIYYPLPLHLQPAYVKAGGRLGDAPQAETLANEVLSLPMHPYLTEDEITRVANAIQEGLR